MLMVEKVETKCMVYYVSMLPRGVCWRRACEEIELD